ncbi:hypothetical protein N658DRAFT_501915 [Parathielavia hyrcaniae]|uniref:Uncharacterized protein n=1 Tax=Parathielavia hyrcaniae TaxID=113614 RepID=A0AAN6SX10_9PEZI|nr:hypothetical protein N658DRAFT_501915 [Parathielavia hyrcaniae]
MAVKSRKEWLSGRTSARRTYYKFLRWLWPLWALGWWSLGRGAGRTKGGTKWCIVIRVFIDMKVLYLSIG